MPKLSKEDLKKKVKYHKARAKFYDQKLKDSEKEDKKIGFKFY